MTKMNNVKWTEEHLVGIPTFDKQHKRLYDLLNDFYKDVKNDAGYSKLLNGINALKEYSIYHFESEENMMKRHNFSGYELHKMQHDAFLQEISKFEELYKNGELLLTLEITQYIKVWLEIHIDKTDSQYAEFLIAQGVK